MQLEVVHTDDGSVTLLNKALDATYHSKFGAIQESTHIFINAGLNFAIANLGKKINVLEIGFGTGLNALLTLQEANKKQLKVNYFAIEKYPLQKDIIDKLNYIDLLKSEKEELAAVLNCEWDKENKINSNFTISKCKCDANEFYYQVNVDVIYYDAFGPDVAPEMWRPAIFGKLFDVLNPGGCLVTFCAKGDVKRMLKQTGFVVEALQGAPGKREMTRAIKK